MDHSNRVPRSEAVDCWSPDPPLAHAHTSTHPRATDPSTHPSEFHTLFASLIAQLLPTQPIGQRLRPFLTTVWGVFSPLGSYFYLIYYLGAHGWCIPALLLLCKACLPQSSVKSATQIQLNWINLLNITSVISLKHVFMKKLFSYIDHTFHLPTSVHYISHLGWIWRKGIKLDEFRLYVIIMGNFLAFKLIQSWFWNNISFIKKGTNV